MTVQELITILASYPQDMRVVVNGYEEGYEDLDSLNIKQVPIVLNKHKEWYYGRHGGVYFGETPDCKALLLGR